MAKDHYVAQTYLKHWCDPKNKPPLQVYRKSDLKHFPCRPRDVCHEWDGDLIPEYLTDPGRLGKFRKIFEPRWKPTVERLCAGNIDPKDKLVLSMAWAHFFLFPPAQREIAKGIHANEVREMARSLFEATGSIPRLSTLKSNAKLISSKGLARSTSPAQRGLSTTKIG